MRLLVEIFVIGALIYLGWEKTFSQRVDEIRGVTTPAAASRSASAMRVVPGAAAPALPAVSPTIAAQSQSQQDSGSWMFDPNRHSTLDAPKHSATPH